jgi:FAD/FMN-containing dehydrogenase
VARLLCGSEGSLAVTLGATLRLVPVPPHRALLVLGFEYSVVAADSAPVILPHHPLTMESINAALVELLPAQARAEAVRAGLPEGKAWLLVEVGGAHPEEAARAGRAIEADLIASGLRVTSTLVTEPRAQTVLWRCRRDGTGLATRRPDGGRRPGPAGRMQRFRPRSWGRTFASSTS